MTKYKLSNVAQEDLIRIHHFGVTKFGVKQADKYFETFFKSQGSKTMDFRFF